MKSLDKSGIAIDDVKNFIHQANEKKWMKQSYNVFTNCMIVQSLKTSCR
jgi:hypothetical protein